MFCGLDELVRVSLSSIVVNVFFEGRFTPSKSALCLSIPSEVIVPVVPLFAVIMAIASMIYEPVSSNLGHPTTRQWWRSAGFIVHKLFPIYAVTTK